MAEPARDPAAVIAEARAGSNDALASIYHDHANALLAVAYRLLLSQADAEDVVHDVFVGLPEALRRYEERGSFGAWLKRITVRVALSRIRTAQREVGLDQADTVDSGKGAPARVAHIDRCSLDRVGIDRLRIEDACDIR